MSSFRVKNKDGTWDKVPVLGSYQAVLAANEAATNAQNAANAAEAVAPEYAKTKSVLDNIVSYTNTATTQADLATTKATNAANSATNAAQSYANADAIASQLTEYLNTKEELTAPAVDKTLLIEGAAADSKVVGELKSDLVDLRNIGKTKLEKTGTDIFLSERDVSDVSIPTNTEITKHGRNRFDLNNAVLKSTNGFSSVNVKKENGGVKIETSFTTDVGSQQVYFEYTSEFDGNLYISCIADCEDSFIESLSFGVRKNNVALQTVYGKGKLLIVVPVAKNDIIRVNLYSHIKGELAPTLFYKNIMLAYDGEYEYLPYYDDTTNVQSSYEYASFSIPSVESELTTESSNISGLYIVTVTNTKIQGLSLPEDLYTKANIKVTGELPLLSYREVYKNNNGIGVSTSGKISIYKDGIGRTSMATYLAEHPITIEYITGETRNIAELSYKDGEIITMPQIGTVTYFANPHEHKGKIVCFGDSVTGMFSCGTDYPSMITRETDIEAINVGFHGCQYTDHKTEKYVPFCMNRLVDSIVSGDYSLQDASSCVDSSSSDYQPLYAEHLSNLKAVNWKEVDYVSLFWGTNDWGNNAIMLSDDDSATSNKQRTNCEDSIQYCVSNLLSKYPHLKIIVICPYWRSVSADKDSNVDPNTKGDYLYQYADMIEKCARFPYGLPVLNLYYDLGVNKITNRFFTSDGTHPTEMTKHIIVNRIVDTIFKY